MRDSPLFSSVEMAWISLLLGVALGLQPQNPFLWTATLILALLLHSRWLLVTLFVGLGSLLTMGRLNDLTPPLWIAASSEPPRLIRVHIVEEKKWNSLGEVVQLEGVVPERKTLVITDSFPIGSRLSGRALLKPLSTEELSAFMSRENDWHQQNLIGRLKFVEISHRESQPRPIEQLRRFLRHIVHGSHPRAEAFRRALFLGEGSALSSEEWRQLNLVSLSHAIVVSGSHLVWLSRSTLPLLRGLSYLLPFGLPFGLFAWRLILTMLLILYTMLCGEEISIVRALLFVALISSGALIFPRLHRIRPQDRLAVIGVILAIANPFSVISPTYLLSFWTSWILCETVDASKRWSLTLPAALSVPLLHALAMPSHWLAWIFGLILIFPFMLGIVPLLCLGLLHPRLDSIAGGALAAFFHVLSLLEHFLQWTWLPSFPGLILSLVAMAAIACALRLKKYLWVIGILFALLLWPLVRDASIVTDENALHVIDVGQGDALVLEMEGQRFFIDGGSDARGPRNLFRFLETHGWNFTSTLTLSHLDKDHFGFWKIWAPFFRWNAIWVSGPDARLKTWPQRQEAPQEWCGAQFCLRSWKTSWTSKNSERTITNNQSLALILYRRLDRRLIGLSLGDMDRTRELELMTELQRDAFWISPAGLLWLKSAHHGSRTSSDEDFLRWCRPQIVIVNSGRNNSYGHPHDESLTHFEAQGARVVDTARSGHFKVSF